MKLLSTILLFIGVLNFFGQKCGLKNERLEVSCKTCKEGKDQANEQRKYVRLDNIESDSVIIYNGKQLIYKGAVIVDPVLGTSELTFYLDEHPCNKYRIVLISSQNEITFRTKRNYNFIYVNCWDGKWSLKYRECEIYYE